LTRRKTCRLARIDRVPSFSVTKIRHRTPEIPIRKAISTAYKVEANEKRAKPKLREFNKYGSTATKNNSTMLITTTFDLPEPSLDIRSLCPHHTTTKITKLKPNMNKPPAIADIV